MKSRRIRLKRTGKRGGSTQSRLYRMTKAIQYPVARHFGNVSHLTKFNKEELAFFTNAIESVPITGRPPHNLILDYILELMKTEDGALKHNYFIEGTKEYKRPTFDEFQLFFSKLLDKNLCHQERIYSSPLCKQLNDLKKYYLNLHRRAFQPDTDFEETESVNTYDSPYNESFGGRRKSRRRKRRYSRKK